MSEMLQQLFNFYFRGGWLWLALIPLLLLIFIVIDNQRRQRQALTWILFLAGCLCVFAPSLFYSLSDGRALTQSTREIFYAGVLGVTGAVLGLIGYVVSFQWRIQPSHGLYPSMNINADDHASENDLLTEITGQGVPAPQAANGSVQRSPSSPSAKPPTFFSNVPIVVVSREFAPGWLQDQAGRQYRLHKGITQVGREDDQQIRLTEMSVSRQHALIRYEQYARGDAFLLQGIGKSETALNGVILGKESKQLYDGDCIRLGTIELTFFTQAGR